MTADELTLNDLDSEIDADPNSEFNDTDPSPKDQLYVLDEETNDDGTVNAKIRTVNLPDDIGDDITIEYYLPRGETETRSYPWPDRATNDYRAVELAAHFGYSVHQIEALEGERIKYDDGPIIPTPRLRNSKIVFNTLPNTLRTRSSSSPRSTPSSSGFQHLDSGST